MSASISPSASTSPSSSLSPSSSVSASISPSASRSPSSSASPSLSPSASQSPSASPSQGYEDYTRGVYSVLPTDATDLTTAYSTQDYIDVSTSNDVRVGITGTDQYVVHQYKDFTGGRSSGSVHWEGQSTQAPSVATIYLQVYNVNTTTWETLASNNSAAANTDFTLDGSIPNLTNYQDAYGITACRIYQRVV